MIIKMFCLHENFKPLNLSFIKIYAYRKLKFRHYFKDLLIAYMIKITS